MLLLQWNHLNEIRRTQFFLCKETCSTVSTVSNDTPPSVVSEKLGWSSPTKAPTPWRNEGQTRSNVRFHLEFQNLLLGCKTMRGSVKKVRWHRGLGRVRLWDRIVTVFESRSLRTNGIRPRISFTKHMVYWRKTPKRFLGEGLKKCGAFWITFVKCSPQWPLTWLASIWQLTDGEVVEMTLVGNSHLACGKVMASRLPTWMLSIWTNRVGSD